MKELLEAVKRRRRINSGERERTVYDFDDEEMDSFMCRMLENQSTGDLRFIADALTDPSPLTREALEQLGGRLNSPEGNPNIEVVFEVGQSVLFVAYWKVRDRWEFHLRERPGDFAQTLFPQPQTVGDLKCLLLRLMR